MGAAVSIKRKPTATGYIVKFSPQGPMPVPVIEWPHKGAVPSAGMSDRGDHVNRLVIALNDWWERCNGRAIG